MKILLVEDDDRIAEPTKEYLEEQHYVVDVAADGEAGWALASSGLYDLILLDIMLPKLDGVSICRRLRQTDHLEPILMMTARGSEQDKVSGLDSGADDYLVKPFGMEELAARIRALIRRGTQKRHPMLTSGKLTLDPATCRVDCDGRTVDVTPTEYRLLAHFLRYPNAIFSREALIDRLWLQGDVPTEDVVRMHIMGLRTKLHQAGAPRNLIETVYGRGYRLAEDAK